MSAGERELDVNDHAIGRESMPTNLSEGQDVPNFKVVDDIE